MQLELRSISQTMGDRTLYRDLNITIAKGECWALLGINGAGKSTLLHTMAGIQKPTAGTVLLDGIDMATLSRRRIAEHLGILLQRQSDEFPISVLETALAGCHPRLGLWGWESDKERQEAEEWLDKLDLTGFEQRLTTTLSGGERRRLAVATLMMQQPQLALLDEPDNHLDPARRKQVIELLTNHFSQSKRSAVISLHDVNLAARHCSHILMLNGDGEWRAGPKEEQLNRENLEKLYRCGITILQGPAGDYYLPAYE